MGMTVMTVPSDFPAPPFAGSSHTYLVLVMGLMKSLMIIGNSSAVHLNFRTRVLEALCNIIAGVRRTVKVIVKF